MILKRLPILVAALLLIALPAAAQSPYWAQGNTSFYTGLTMWKQLGADAATPPTDYWQPYFKSDGMYYKDDLGNVVGPLGAGGGGIGPVTDEALLMGDGTSDAQDVPFWSGAGGILLGSVGGTTISIDPSTPLIDIFAGSQATVVLLSAATGDTFSAFQMNAAGTVFLGSGSGAADLQYGRGAAGVLALGGGDAFTIPGAAGDFGSPIDGMIWYNTTSDEHRFYRNGAWTSMITSVAGDTSGIDVSTDGEGAATVSFDSTEVGSTTWGSGSTINWDFNAGTVDPQISIQDGVIVFNENSQDVDVRFETDNNLATLFIDGGLGHVGVGTQTPAGKLDVSTTDDGSLPFPRMTTAQRAALASPTQGEFAYDTDEEALFVYDSTRWIKASSVGWAIKAYSVNYSNSHGYATADALAANGGTMLIPINVTGHMLLESVSIRQTDTSNTRTWDWDLYVQDFNSGDASQNTLRRVVATAAADTFTASVSATTRTLAASADTYLAPGLYWLAIQNQHATNTFGIAFTGTTSGFAPNINQEKTTTNPNGATLDAVAATWVKNSVSYGVCLNGVVFGQTAAY